jgi:RimJ/RimL family protein N-acetyltransferase
MLEGKLVRLRAIEPEDRLRAAAWLNDPEVTYYLGERYGRAGNDGGWMTESAAPGFMDVRLAIETREGVHIGGINLHRVHAEDRKAGLGIIIGAKDSWGRGYGGDAIETLLRFAFDEMNLNRVWLTVTAGHERGIACYRRCGFSEEARERDGFYKHGRYWDFIVMGILRREFDVRLAGEGGSHA